MVHWRCSKQDSKKTVVEQFFILLPLQFCFDFPLIVTRFRTNPCAALIAVSFFLMVEIKIPYDKGS